MLPPFADVHGGVSPGVPQDDLPVLVKRRGSSFAGCAAHAYHRRPMSLETKERRSKFSPKVPYQHLEKKNSVAGWSIVKACSGRKVRKGFAILFTRRPNLTSSMLLPNTDSHAGGGAKDARWWTSRVPR